MMNKDQVGGNWKQIKGKVKEQWGDLTDDDMTVIEGKRDQLVGKIQERYGYEKDQAEKEVGDRDVPPGRPSGRPFFCAQRGFFFSWIEWSCWQFS